MWATITQGGLAPGRVLNSTNWEFWKGNDEDQSLMEQGKTGSIHDHFQHKNFTVGKAIDETRSVSVQL